MSKASLRELRTAFGRRLLIAATLLATVTATPVTAAAPDADIETRNEAVVRDAFGRWAAGTGTVFDLLSPDIRWTIHGSGPLARTYLGLEDFIEQATAPLVSRLATPVKPVLHHIWAADDRIIIRFEASATTKAGEPYRNQYVWIFRMKGGAVVEAEAFLDLVAYQDVLDGSEPRAP